MAFFESRPALRNHIAARLQRAMMGVRLVEAIAALLVIGLELAAEHPASWMGPTLSVSYALVIGAFFIRLVDRFFIRREGARDKEHQPFLLLAGVGVALGLLVSLRLGGLVALIHDGLRFVFYLRKERPQDRLLVDAAARPARSLLVSFGSLIALGTFLLALPASHAGKAVGLVDALFTSVSAVCVTGLAVVDTPTAWSPFGQAIILALIQLGGLGIMALTAFMALTFGRDIGLKQNAMLRGAFDEPDAEEMKALVTSIVGLTLVIEGTGALILFPVFAEAMPWPEALWQAVFHAVSAFCNAGFSLFSDNLVGFVGHVRVNVVVMTLVVLGGLGFGVLVSLLRLVKARRLGVLPLHSKIVLLTSGLLIWIGALGFFFFEYDASLAGLSMRDKVLASVFHSVVSRTAGFNTVPLDAALIHPATLLLLVALMFVGASPGSTGGGIKTTTAAVLFLSVKAVIMERADLEVFGRKISRDVVLKTLAITCVAGIVLSVGLGSLVSTEAGQPLGALLFEATSALGTVGLSLGVSPHLSAAGKLVVCALMFIGRVGGLSVVAALMPRVPASRLAHPEGRLLVG